MEDRENIFICGLTDTGKRRTNNEDAFVAEKLDDNAVLAVVIDGVGGYEGGEVAAEIAQREIPSYLKEFNRGERLELLKQAVVCANNAIFDRRHLDTERPNMGCVLTSVIIDDSRKVIDMVHVGDTRLYQFNKGELIKLSHDHSFVGYCEEIGDLTEEQAMHHPRRNEISRSVGEERHGVNDQGFLEAVEFPLLPNSTFLLCSDGLTDLITSKQIIGILEQAVSLEEKTQALINAANEAGGKDNVTVVLVEYQAEEVSSAEVEAENSQAEDKTEEVLHDASNRGKCKICKLVPILSFVTLLLSVACVVLLISSKSKDNQIQDLEEKVVQLTFADSASKFDASDTVDTLNDFVSILNPVKTMAVYSKAVEENDFETISKLYASHLRRYFDAHNISNQKVIKKHRNYDNRYGVIGKSINIRWDTWEAKQLPNGEVSIDFVEDYGIDRIDTTKKSKYVLNYHVIFDRDGKIVSIYYDELH
jgi:Serine/threonine protein phosphatase